jgi:hypothetical protein
MNLNMQVLTKLYCLQMKMESNGISDGSSELEF